MEVVVIRVSFIGAGKVGFSLGKYFKENNITVIGYYSKNLESAKEAAKFTSTIYFEELKSMIDCSDTIFITTPDGVIKEVWNEIKKLSIKNKIICHCSGSLSSSVFSNIEDLNSYGYSIHPMFAISDKYNSYQNLKQAVITVEGSEKYLIQIKSLIESLGNSVQVISKDNKALYHAASVVASNQVLALVKQSVTYLKECGFSEENALGALYPLILNNIFNIKDKGITASLTGPIERCDVATIKGHMECLDEEDRELYRLLSKKLVTIAKIKNLDRNYIKLEEVLGD